MTVHDAAAVLGVSRATFHRLMKAHNLTPIETDNPALQRVRRYHFYVADVLALREKLIAARVSAPPAEPKPRKKRPAPTHEVTAVYTPPTVAAVERLLR